MNKQKRTIFFLAVTMALIFFGLLFIQTNYLKQTIAIRNEQFNESAKRSLAEVVHNLEEEEADKYLNKSLIEEQGKKHQIKKEKFISQNIKIGSKTVAGETSFFFEQKTSINPQVYLSKKNGNNTIESTSTILQDKLREQYLYQKALLDNVAMRWLKETAQQPIEKRINFNELDILIKIALENNGLNVPYHFSIIDDNGKIIYKCADFQNLRQKDFYEQKLFPNDQSEKENYLRIYFPTKKEYIMSSMTMVIPSIILTALLLITFTITLLIIFRQKKLSDIKNDFVNNMTHEFKTPISTISLASQMLQDQSVTKTPETLKYISNVIKDETRRLSFQVEKVLQISIFEHEKSTFKFTELDINEIIANSIANFSLKVDSKGGKIISDLKAEDAWAMVDELHFTNVIFNLMDNAVKYSREDNPVELTISTWNEKDSLFIAIQDNGIGMKKEDLKKIFDKFYRVPTGNLHNVKGFGLGLAYVRKIVQGHNGQIKVESELNHGSKFIIRIPTLKKIE